MTEKLPMLGIKDTIAYLESLPVEDKQTMERALNRVRYSLEAVPVIRSAAVKGKRYSKFYCGNCHLEVKIEDYYCSRCGKAISWGIPR